MYSSLKLLAQVNGTHSHGKVIEMSVKVGDRIVADVSLSPEVTIIKNNVRTKYRVISEKDIQMVLDDGEEVQ